MRIAVNTRFLLPGQLEGIGWFTHEVTRRLVKKYPGWRFDFLFDRPFREEFLYGENVHPHVLFPPARHPLLWYWWFEGSVANWLKRHAVDVFFSPDTYLSLRADTPTVLVAHDIAYAHYPEQIPFLARKYYEHFVPRYLRQAARIVTVSEFGRRDILAHYPELDPEKFDLACNGVKEQLAPLSEREKEAVRQEITGGHPYFFYLGAVHPRKNVDRLIRAFDRFKETSGEPHRLVIAGRFAWQTDSVRRAYEQSPYREQILLQGYLGPDELRRVLGAAFALTYVSLFEGFGVPILEAMQCEVPVITSDVSSMPEVAGDAALLVDPHSIEGIAQAMRQLTADPHLVQGLLEKGREQAQRFTWDRASEVVERSILKAVR